MKLIRMKYEGGPANGFAGSVTPNCRTIDYGSTRQTAVRYVRSDRIDDKGRMIFVLE